MHVHNLGILVTYRGTSRVIRYQGSYGDYQRQFLPAVFCGNAIIPFLISAFLKT